MSAGRSRSSSTEICNVYGSTETYGNCCVTHYDAPLEIRLTTQGPPLPGVEMRVVDPQGAVLGVGEPAPGRYVRDLPG